MSEFTDSTREFIALGKQLGAAGGLLRFAAIEQPAIRVIACNTAMTRIIEVDGRRYRARRCDDDDRECWTWGPTDEIKGGE